MASARVLSQAKVNLFLRVLAREASGFHQLETLFCRLTLGDEVRVRLTGGERSLDCAGIAMPSKGLGPVESNLAWRAAATFLETTGWRTGFAIEIEKRIPVGGGLGGGSADAGGVLRALNALAPNPLTPHDLLRVGASLGADVPFLTQDRSPLALAWGRGDRLLPLPPLPQRPCVLLVFAEGVSTADAYRWLAESPATPAGAVGFAIDRFGRWSDVDLMAYNEFERVVLPRRADIRQALDGMRRSEIRATLPVSLMSGSGATVFALGPFPDETAATGGYHLHIAIGGEGRALDAEGSAAEGRSSAAIAPPITQVLETYTADHVEPVRLGD